MENSIIQQSHPEAAAGASTHWDGGLLPAAFHRASSFFKIRFENTEFMSSDGPPAWKMHDKRVPVTPLRINIDVKVENYLSYHLFIVAKQPL